MSYDSTADTLRHSRRVGELVSAVVKELLDRAFMHDLSKAREPELALFNKYTPKLREMTYGSPEYAASLEGLRPALEHHYANNPHHPEHHADGIAGMTLIDLIEMLADWKASTERMKDGDLGRSLAVNSERFGISEQLLQILSNTADRLGWLSRSDHNRTTCGETSHHPCAANAGKEGPQCRMS